ncbi:hypothetical protein HYW75_03485 [Candidatus Pacearchaeota archaeon]|nr:hypothetical protein [Candidatus Pacearchaeota archaeon]
MGELKILLPENIEKIFRRTAMKRFGYQKGSISKAAQEAIQSWALAFPEKYEEEESWDSLIGILKHVKKSSVELQHEAWDSVVKKYARRR